jgi:hypothetical protein
MVEVDADDPVECHESLDPFRKLREDTIVCLNSYRIPDLEALDQQLLNKITISSIQPWGSAVRDQFIMSNRTTLLDECIWAVRAQGDERAYEVSGKVPSVEEYLGYRIYSIGIGLELAMLQ